MKLKTFIRKNFIFLLLLITVLIAGRCFSISFAAGESMEPAISPPAVLLINRLDRDYSRNDIVVCRTDGFKTITKRIIGLPGETITVTTDGRVLIDNVLYEDPYGNITVSMFLDGDRSYPVTLASDEYFVMGDNRNVSADSRNTEIGNIKEKNIIGKVMNY